MEPSGSSHQALSVLLAYLPLYELLSMNQACKPFRDAISNDVLIWLDIIVQRRLSLCLNDESLIKIASKANGRLQNLALLNCVRITDVGLMRVVNENPHISKLYVPHCTNLTPEGVIRVVTTLTKGSNYLTSVKINGIYNLNQQHLQALESNLPKSQDWKQRFYHKYDNCSFRSIDEDTRPIDVEMCPKCQDIRLVFDCARKSCGDRCRGCHCIPRCEGCGKCITDVDNEQGKTICSGYLCLDCWLSLPKCNHCNRTFCPRHAGEESKLMSGSSGFVCQYCQHGSFKYM